MIPKKRIRISEEGELESFLYENSVKIIEIIDDGFYASNFEGEEIVRLQIDGMGDRKRKLPLKRGNTVKIIIKYKKDE